MNKIWKRNINLDYIYCFCKNFSVTNAIWVLYMVYRGLPLWQVGVAEGAYHLTSFLFEVPSGAAADLLGRKRVCIIGRILCAVSSLLILCSGGLFGFAIAFAINALSDNLNSGSEEALVYDSMKAMGEEKSYIKVNSRLNIIMEVARGFATVVGGILAEKSYTLCYVTAIVITLISLIPGCMMKEPPMFDVDNDEKNKEDKGDKEDKENKDFDEYIITNQKINVNEIENVNLNKTKEQNNKNQLQSETEKQKISIKEHFVKSYHIVKENPAVIKILIYYPTVAAFYTVLYFYGQQYLSENGMNKIEISIVMLLGSLASCLGAFSSDGMLRRCKGMTKYIAAFMMAVSIICVSMESLVVIIVAFLAASFVNALLYPIESSSLNALIPSEQRATIISVDSMCFSMAMICFFPLCGWLATAMNLRVTFVVLGVVELLMTCTIWIGKSGKVQRNQMTSEEGSC